MFTNILGFEVFNKDMKTFMEYIEKYEKVNKTIKKILEQ